MTRSRRCLGLFLGMMRWGVERYDKRKDIGDSGYGGDGSELYTQADVLIFGLMPLKELFMYLVSS